jgi:NAD(P)-dependent dehydrogenase (short-subunit alcohol dehydrogenase family)
MGGGRVNCLVTGGSGFLGKHLVQQLVESGLYNVTIFDIRDAQVAGANTVVGDLRDPDQVRRTVKGLSSCARSKRLSPCQWGCSDKLCGFTALKYLPQFCCEL